MFMSLHDFGTEKVERRWDGKWGRLSLRHSVKVGSQSRHGQIAPSHQRAAAPPKPTPTKQQRHHKILSAASLRSCLQYKVKVSRGIGDNFPSWRQLTTTTTITRAVKAARLAAGSAMFVPKAPTLIPPAVAPQ